MRLFLTFLTITVLYLFQLPFVSAEGIKTSQLSTTSQIQNNNSNQFIIKFKDSTNNLQKQIIYQASHVHEISSIENRKLSLVSISAGSDPQKVKKLLSTFNQVEMVEPNLKVTPSYTPSDSSYSKQWYEKKINMPLAWSLTLGRSDIKVAVVDAGLQTTHPELKAKIIKPYNVMTGENSVPASIHGTHVAGIIAAANNKIGITGIAPNVKLIPVNVFQGTEADIYTVAEGIDYAVKAGADIINLSLTTEDYTAILDDSIQSAIKKGVLVVAAVGNDHTSQPQYPAAYKNVIAVSATTETDKRASFSNYGSYIDLSAPGVNIYSTAPTNSYKIESGTSMATPIVSGVAALILSKNPFLTTKEVTAILEKTSKDLGQKGWDKYYGYGRVDAYQALKHTPAPLSKIRTSSQTFAPDGKNRLSLSINAIHGTKISLYVDNIRNSPIRKLVTNKTWSGGTYSTKWDGKMDNKAFTPAGKVKIIAKVTNGKHTVYKSTYITIKKK